MKRHGRLYIGGREWEQREARLRLIFVTTRGVIDAVRIAEQAKCEPSCTPHEARLIASLRALAVGEVLEHYENGRLTFGRAWAIAARVPAQQAASGKTSLTEYGRRAS